MRLQVHARKHVPRGPSLFLCHRHPKYCLYMAQTGETWSLVLLYARAEMGYYLFIVAVVYCSTC